MQDAVAYLSKQYIAKSEYVHHVFLLVVTSVQMYYMPETQPSRNFNNINLQFRLYFLLLPR